VLGVKCFLTHSGIDEFPNVTEKDLDEAMPIIAKYQLPLLAHCELYDAEVDCGFVENPTSYQHYLASRPKNGKMMRSTLMISKCREHNCPVHIACRVCRSFRENRRGKKEGLPLPPKPVRNTFSSMPRTYQTATAFTNARRPSANAPTMNN
jgi:allantoinase